MELPLAAPGWQPTTYWFRPPTSEFSYPWRPRSEAKYCYCRTDWTSRNAGQPTANVDGTRFLYRALYPHPLKPACFPGAIKELYPISGRSYNRVAVHGCPSPHAPLFTHALSVWNFMPVRSRLCRLQKMSQWPGQRASCKAALCAMLQVGGT